MKRRVWWALGAVALLCAGTFSACCQMKEHAAATAKCSSSPSSEACNTCCKGEGVNGHAYSTGDGCKCIDLTAK